MKNGLIILSSLLFLAMVGTLLYYMGMLDGLLEEAELATESEYDCHKELFLGIEGPEVIVLQRFINQLRANQYGHDMPLTVNGIFDGATLDAVREEFGSTSLTLYQTNSVKSCPP